MMFDQIHKDVEKRMDASIQSSRSEMSGIRAGRASPSMLDSIKVETYGQKMNINQVANITTPDARTINIEIINIKSFFIIIFPIYFKNCNLYQNKNYQ